MFKSPLVRTLQLLSQNELEDLHLFVASPLFNEVHRHRDKIRLFEFLKQYFPAFDHKNLEREEAGKILFPERTNPKAELERTMALLYAIVRQYITLIYFDIRSNRIQSPSQEEIQHNPERMINYSRQQLALLRYYRERQFDNQAMAPSAEGSFFPNLYKNLNDLFQRQTDLSAFDEYSFLELYHIMFLAKYEKANFESHNKQIFGDANLLEVVEQLDQYYLLYKLDLMSKLIVRQKLAQLFVEEPDKSGRFEENLAITRTMIKELTGKYKKLRTPAISVFCALFEFCSQQTIGEESDKYAEKFYRIIRRSTHREAVPARRLIDFNILLRNYWAGRYNMTREIRFLERNHLMQLEQLRLLPPSEPLASSQFQTIIRTALKLQKTNWTEEMLNKTTPANIFGEEHYDIMMDILWAYLYFVKAEFKKAQTVLPFYITYGILQDAYLYTLAASLDLKIRYELNQMAEEETANMIHTTTTRIKRFTAFPQIAREMNLRFFALANKLSKLKMKKAMDKKANILAKLEGIRQEICAQPVAEQEWLQEKCIELF